MAFDTVALGWLPSLPDIAWLGGLLSVVWFLVKVYSVILVVVLDTGHFSPIAN